ncbi:MAG: hypothetical protein ABI743_05160, partial [bacterium]
MVPDRRLLSLCALAMLGCQHAATPIDPATATASVPVPVYALHDGGDSLVGMFTMTLDPVTLETTVTPVRGATAQPPQGQLYDLDIANFLNSNGFRVTGVQVLGSGNFRVTFSHAHPFPAPNIANPITGINRADLGYTGRLVILAEGNPQLFYGGTVRVSAGTVVGADGYAGFGDLLVGVPQSLVNTYPYKLLADEAKDNRVGISNGGDPEGTYAAASGGWQRINLGANGTGWTGFDYLHGGQSITNSFVLDKDAVGQGSFELNVALVIQYQDPRGAGGKTLRLPPVTPDVLQFAYRLPYADLDCSVISGPASLAIAPTVAATVPLALTIRDWDATAAESTDSKVGDESDVSKVQLGASGEPTVEMDAPSLSATVVDLGASTDGTGFSNDPLAYGGTLTNNLGTAPGGEAWALVRVTDPEAADAARGTYHTGVDGTTVAPNAALTLDAVTYQLLPITVAEPLHVPVITSVTPTGIVGAVDEMVTFSAVVSDPGTYAWDFGFGPIPDTSTEAEPTVQLHGPEETYFGTLVVSNAAGDSAPFPFSYRILPPIKPYFFPSRIEAGNLFPGHHDSRLAQVIGGRPIVLYTVGGGNGLALHCARALTTFPEGPSDWNVHLIQEPIGSTLSTAVVNGRMAATIGSGDADSSGLFVYADIAAPSGTSDWTVTTTRTALAGQDWNQLSSLVDLGGRAAFLTREEMTSAVHYFYANTFTPASPADWTTYPLLLAADDFNLITQNFIGEGDRLVAGVAVTASNSTTIMGATATAPASPANWHTGPLSIAVQPVGIALCAGPVFGNSSYVMLVQLQQNGNVTYFEASGATAATVAKTYQTVMPDPGEVATNVLVSITSLNERSAIQYDGLDTGPIVLRARRIHPVLSDWETVTLPDPFFQRASILSVN